jgi:Dyp-type peroxidase family
VTLSLKAGGVTHHKTNTGATLMINLNALFDDTDLGKPETLHALKSLQANILKGHGRDHVALIFLKITDVAKARTFVHHYPVTDAATQFVQAQAFRDTGEPGSLVRLLLVSYTGLKAFGHQAHFNENQPHHDPFFVMGMGQDSEVLDRGGLDSWQSALKHDPLHLLLLFAHDDPVSLAAVVGKALGSPGLTSAFKVLLVQEGRAYRNIADEGIEHFGYVDGRSQPLLTKTDLAKEDTEHGGVNLYNPQTNLSQILFQDPLAPNGVGHGSYFVFRKLEQDVAGFKQAEDALQETFTTNPHNDDLAGAMIVGRFENGVPTTLWKTPPPLKPVTNNFNYGQDAAGESCPFQGHIRKTNPRGSSPGGLDFDRAVQMARRGITYGARLQDPTTKELLDQPNDGVGLLFMSYQKSIKDQFHFMQKNWANTRKFPHVKTEEAFDGIDPIIGQLAAGDNGLVKDHRWPDHSELQQVQGFVHLKGGEYFYAPSPLGVKRL